MRTILGVMVSALLICGCSGATSSAPPAASAAGQSGAFGGTVQFQMEGQAATTKVDATADGATVSGSAVTQIGSGTHSVKVDCAAKVGDMWALGGKADSTTVHGGRVGDWSAVIVKDASPQLIGIWVSEDAASATDCAAWLKAIDFATIETSLLRPVQSGTLVAPKIATP